MVLKQLHSDETLLQKYLLGQASADDRRTIEQRLMTEQDYFNLLLRMEEDLTDSYVCGDLKGLDKEAFEKHFLSNPERQRNLEFAQDLHRYLLANTQLQTIQPWWRGARGIGEIALLCAVLVLAIISCVLWHKTAQLNNQLALSELQRSQAEQHEKILTQQLEQAQQSEKQKVAQPNPPLSPDQDLLSLVLTPGINRAADHVVTAVLRPGKRRLLLKLRTEDTSRNSYRAELQTLEGEVIWTRTGLKQQQSKGSDIVEVELPASLLRQRDYLLVLSDAAPDGSVNKVGTYYFRVEK